MTVVHSYVVRATARVAFVIAVAAPLSAGAQETKAPLDIVATIQASATYKTFARLITTANLASMLQGSAQFTVFAPTDAAFAKLPAAQLTAFEKDTTQLQKILRYHIVSDVIPANKMLNLRTVRTLEGSKAEFSVREARLRVNDAVIVHPDITASNGLIHGIESVLMPPSK